MRFIMTGMIALAIAGCSSEAPEAENTVTTTETPDAARTARIEASRQVMIGKHGPQMDACGSLGRIRDATAAREGPALTAAEKTQLKAGQQVKMCDTSEDGKWLGVVYHPRLEQLPDCGTGSPVADVQPYRGACSSGWVQADMVEPVAG